MNEKKLVIIIAALTQLTTQFIANMVILAMPEIAVDMNLGVSFETQIYLIYLVAVIAFTIPLSKIVTQYGVKRCMIICNIALIVSLLISVFALDVNFIFISRIIQGICVAILSVTIYILVVNELPEDEVGSALGIVGACGYIGMMFAPTLMGVLLHFVNWRLAFAAFIPLMFIQIVLLSKVKKEFKSDKKPIDKLGITLFVLAMLILVAGLSTLHLMGIWLIVVSVLVFIIFLLVEKRKENPMYNVKLLRDFKYVIGNYAAMVTYFVSSITILILNYHLLYIHDFSSYEIGLILLVTPTVMTIVSLFAGRLSDKYDPRLISGIALSIILISVVLLLHLVYVSFDLVIIASIIQGIGHGLFSSPNNKYVLTRVSDEDLPDASSLLSTSKEFGKMLSGNMYTFICVVAFGELALGPDELDLLLLNVDFMMIFITVLFCLSGVIMVFVSKYVLKSDETESY